MRFSLYTVVLSYYLSGKTKTKPRLNIIDISEKKINNRRNNNNYNNKTTKSNNEQILITTTTNK